MDAKLLRWLAEDWPAPAVYRTVRPADPAVATDWTITAPGESTWVVVGITATLVTDANVANRHPDLTLTDGSTTLWRLPAGAVITAGITTIISWLPMLGYASPAILGNRLTVGTPEVCMVPGWTIGTTGSALQAGDQWSSVALTAVEVFSGHVERERAIADSIRDEAEAIAGLIMGEL